MSKWKSTIVLMSILITVRGNAQVRDWALCADVLTRPVTSSGAQVPSQILASLESVLGIFEQHYAPLGLKEHTIGLDWEKTQEQLRERMSKARDSREAMLIFGELFNLMNDAHVNVRLPTSLTWNLPLQILHTPTANGEKGPLVLSFVEPSYLALLETMAGSEEVKTYTLSQLPRVGDEVIKIQGMEPSEFFKAALGSNYKANGNPLTNYSLAAMSLSRLRESSGVNLKELERILGPDRTINFTLKRQLGEGTYELPVKYHARGYSFVKHVFEKDGQFVKYPEGLSPYDPNRTYVPAAEPLEKTSSPETYYHKLSQAVQTAPQSLLESAQDLAVKLHPGYRTMEKFFTVDLPSHPAAVKAQTLVSSVHSLFNLGSETQKYSYQELPLQQHALAADDASSALNIGHYRPLVELPKDFRRIQPPRPFRGLLNASSFFAGTFEHNGKRVGYLRIPSYQVDNIATLQFAVRYYLGQLERYSDYLILDQINNPGGYVMFSDLLIKGLVGRYDHERHMKFAARPTNNFLQQMPQLLYAVEEVASAPASNRGLFRGQLLDEKEVHRLLKGFDEDKRKIYRVLDPDYKAATGQRPHSVFEDDLGLTEPISLSRLSEFVELITDRAVWDILGEPKTAVMASTAYRWLYNYLGVDVLDPSVSYTKPVYMWINDLDFSGGDATPAVLQDLGRAKLVGVRTAGAGGTVNSFSFWRAGEIGLSASLTTSLMVRNRGSAHNPWWVENEGVHPDIPFAITPLDVLSGYKGTLERLLETIEEDLAE